MGHGCAKGWIGAILWAVWIVGAPAAPAPFDLNGGDFARFREAVLHQMQRIERLKREALEELEDSADASGGAREAILATAEKRREIVLGKSRPIFRQMVRERAPDASDAMIEEWFAVWRAGSEKERPARDPAPVDRDEAAPEPAKEFVSLREAERRAAASESAAGDGPGGFFAQSIGAERAERWFVAGTWNASMAGMDVIRIPIFTRQGVVTGRPMSVLTGRESSWAYTNLVALSKEKPVALRLKPVDGMRPVDVIAWPSARNDWSLEVRTSHCDEIPCLHGFLLEASELERGGIAVKPDARKIAVPIRTEPPGAVLYLDGNRYFTPRGDFPVTPLTAMMEPGRRRIRLVLKHHLDYIIESYLARAGAAIDVDLLHESEIDGWERELRTGLGWWDSRIDVRVGDRIWVAPRGGWACGRRGEVVGAAGYPPGEYPHYYAGSEAGARRIENAAYGALLMKIDPGRFPPPGAMAPPAAAESEPIVVDGLTGVDVRIPGSVLFDVNEAEGREHRRDNRGSMSLKIVVIPGGKAPPDFGR
jgi:hypothetical protein